MRYRLNHSKGGEKEMESRSFYTQLSHAPVRAAGNDVDLSIYRKAGEPTYGKFQYKAPAEGLVQVNGSHSEKFEWTDNFEIAYTKVGSKGPLVLFLHGVPTNRAQWEDIQRHVGRFCETIAIDMLGMGESTQPRQYGKKKDKGDNDRWYWKHDADYIEKLMQHEYPGRKFIFVADDWGSGIASHHAAKHNDRLDALVQLDPIAFDGYPVNEIQAIGRASMIPNTPEGDARFAAAFGAFDQTLALIYKTLVHDPAVFNQYKLRRLTFPYVDVDYERNGTGDGVTDVAKSTTLRLKMHNIRVLADRAAILSPALLLPYDAKRNPEGVKYEDITVPTLIMWGEYDNIMPAAQTQRFANVLGTDNVHITYVPRAGHFAGIDQPRFVADTIVNFIRRVKGRKALADINLGNEGIWKGDERLLIEELRAIYGIEVEPH
ncbi:alpha/beta fold hydrolase [Candidatus Methylomirabilis limnetica]|jgi:pimeloyl-ACP methyl ester carboxylesterase|nr:alpha/beta hydrolase [Candidatus Methylomirabilis limnetica]